MKNLKANTPLSFIILTAVYIIACAVGIHAYIILPFDIWLNLLIADVIATVITFIFSLIFNNASVYDPYWSVQPTVILVALSVTRPINVYQILLLLAVLIWGVRLTANWAYTFGNLTCQDWRYTMLKEKTGKFYPLINFIGIHLVPTIVVYACILPAVYAFYYAPLINAGGIIFLAVCLLAVTLQGTADVQMHKFRKDKKKGKINDPFIRRGLWKYARHPNYLGEILMWWGVALSVICVMPNYWFLIGGAVLNTLLFTFVSLPLAEGKQSKKEGYLEYKRQTRAFIPIPKKIKN